MSQLTGRWLLVVAAMLVVPASADAQMFFDAEWISLKMENGADAPLISGPNALKADAGSFDFEPGYRLTIGGQIADYEVYSMFTQVDQFNSFHQSTLGNLLILDDTFNDPVVVPVMPANTLSFVNGLFRASTSTATGSDESTESERLQTGALTTLRSKADYRDFEISIGTNRRIRNWRAAAGYRHIKLDGDAGFVVSGIFDAVDSGTGDVFGDPGNLPNDALSDGALTGAGFTNVGGAADGFDAFDAPGGPDTMTYAVTGSARNELNGGQATFAGAIYQNDWIVIEGIGKAGIYHNRVRGIVNELVVGSVNDDSAYQRQFVNSKTTAAFAGTLGLRGIIALTDYINVIGGYEILFLAGVGLAGDQTAGLSTDPLGNTIYEVRTGNEILHGGHAGLEFTW